MASSSARRLEKKNVVMYDNITSRTTNHAMTSIVSFRPTRWEDDKFCADEGFRVVCNRSRVAEWEKFEAHILPGNQYALKGGKDGKWCLNTSAGIQCDQDSLSTASGFRVVHHGDDSISIQDVRHGKWCAAE